MEQQSAKYAAGLPDGVPAHRRPLPFLFESNGRLTYFTNGLDSKPRSREVFELCIEIAIVVQQHVSVADATCRNDRVDRLADGYALSPQRAKVIGGVDADIVSG